MSTGDQIQRFSRYRMLSAGLFAGLISSYAVALPLAVIMSAQSGPSEILKVAGASGSFGLLLSVPIAFFAVYPITLFLEHRRWTGYRHAALVGAAFGGIIWLIALALLTLPGILGGSQSGIMPVKAVIGIMAILLIFAFAGAVTGLVARAIAGAPKHEPAP